MNQSILIGVGIILPFIGTTLGAFLVFFLKKELKPTIHKLFLGLASGVMLAASIWSLLIPSIELSSSYGKFSFIPAAVGLFLGIIFLYGLNKLVNKIYNNKTNETKRNLLLSLAVTIHNIPEGMSVGVIFAGLISGNNLVSLAGCLALSIGITVQNLPEGAIISLPLKATGASKIKAFTSGMLSGIVEPIFAVLTLILTNFIAPVLPYFLSFAAGSMIYVVTNELIPEIHQTTKSGIGTLGITIGFLIMMVLDVTLG